MVKLAATTADLIVSLKHLKMIKVLKDVKELKALIPKVKADCTK